MVFEPLELAAKLVTIVEQLANCKSQLEKMEKRGEMVLEGVTLELALIARQLFIQSMNMVVDLSTTPINQIPVKTTTPLDCKNMAVDLSTSTSINQIPPKTSTPLDCKKEGIFQVTREAPICQYGVHCSFGHRGKCSYFHPEPGKSRYKVSGKHFGKYDRFIDCISSSAIRRNRRVQLWGALRKDTSL